MKKASLAVALLFTAGMVMGHGGSHQSLPEPGHTPGSIMYGLEQAYESASLALTFNQEKKVKKKIGFAQERLSESAHLAQDNKTELAGEASDRYLKTMNEAEEMANQTGNQNLTVLVQEEKRNSANILEDLQERLPEEASQGIQTALENMHRSQSQDNTPEVSDRSQERRLSGFVATGGVARSE